MTVSSVVTKSGPYTGNGTTTNFGYDFTIQSDTWLKVWVTDSSGTATLQTLGADYTVNGVGSETGREVVFTTAPASGTTILILSNYPYTQLTDFVNQGSFDPQIHEDALDKLTHLAQQLLEITNRSLTLPETSTGVSTELPSPVAGYLLGWNSTADALASLAPADSVIYVGATAPDPNLFPLWYDDANSSLKYYDGSAWVSVDATNKADKVSGATNGNLAALDGTGNLTDAGINKLSVLLDTDIGSAVQAYDPDIPTLAATTAEMQAGAETALRSMSPKNVADAVSALAPTPSTWDFESGELTMTAGSVVSAAHGLGVTPSLFALVIRCKVADLGYTVGDEIMFTGSWRMGTSNWPSALYANSTNIGFAVNTSGYHIWVANKDDTGASSAAINLSSWVAILRAKK